MIQKCRRWIAGPCHRAKLRMSSLYRPQISSYADGSSPSDYDTLSSSVALVERESTDISLSSCWADPGQFLPRDHVRTVPADLYVLMVSRLSRRVGHGRQAAMCPCRMLRATFLGRYKRCLE